MSDTPVDTGATPAPSPAPTPTPSPAPAPVAPKLDDTTPTPTPSPVPTPTPTPTPEAGAVVEYEPTGDAALDVALAFVGKLGISMDHPAMQATATGDFSLIKAHLATMGDKATGWEQMVALAEQAHTRSAAAATEKAAKTQAAVHSVAGGEAQWNEVAAWSSQNASPAEKTEINAMFDLGPVGARAAAMLLVERFSSAKGTVLNPKAATRDSTAAATTAASNGPLSQREYNAAVRDLRAKLGTRMDTSPEYAALRARLR